MIKSVNEWEPKLRQAVVKWMDELSEAVDINGGQAVKWDYKNLQDRFRQSACSHIEILEALRNSFFITITQAGSSRRHFNLTDAGWTFLVNEKYSKLRLLITDQRLREKNKSAIVKRKMRRKVQADPTKQIIDDFRHGVEFYHKGLLKQLRRDRATPSQISRKAIKLNGALITHRSKPIANIRFQNVLPLLLAFETRKFCTLTRNERGVICHEFMSLDWNYRQFATFNGRPYALRLSLELHPKYLRKLSYDFYPALYAYGESCGLSLIYENDAIGVFGDKKAADFQTKFEQVKAYIKQQEAECLAVEGV